jgi:hypothetical protein
LPGSYRSLQGRGGTSDRHDASSAPVREDRHQPADRARETGCGTRKPPETDPPERSMIVAVVQRSETACLAEPAIERLSSGRSKRAPGLSSRVRLKISRIGRRLVLNVARALSGSSCVRSDDSLKRQARQNLVCHSPFSERSIAVAFARSPQGHLPRGAAVRHPVNPTVDVRIRAFPDYVRT